MKRLMALTLTVMMASSVVACSKTPSSNQGAGNSAAPTENVTIKVSTWDLSANPSIKNIADAFTKAHPNIKVDLMDIQSADYTQKLNIMLNGGSDLDAFWIKDADTTKGLFDKGQLTDLTQYIEKDKVDLKAYNGLAENFKMPGGQIVGLPARTDYYVLYYNKDIFDAAKVPYPTNDMTWEEFEATAKKITSGTGADKKYGALLHTWNATVQNWGVQDGKHTILDTDYSNFKPYYEMALRMQNIDKTIMDYGTLKTGQIHYSSPFLTGKVGMMPMGTWFMTTIASKIKSGESKVNWGVATLPHGKDVPAGYTVGAATPISINKASKKQAAAWEFVKFVTSDEGAKVYADAGAIPGRANADTLKSIANMSGMPQGLGDALAVKKITPDRPIADHVAEVNKMLDEEHSLIMLGQKKLDDVIAEMGARSKQLQGK